MAVVTPTRATKEEIYQAAKEIYRDYPELLKALKL